MHRRQNTITENFPQLADQLDFLVLNDLLNHLLSACLLNTSPTIFSSCHMPILQERGTHLDENMTEDNLKVFHKGLLKLELELTAAAWLIGVSLP